MTLAGESPYVVAPLLGYAGLDSSTNSQASLFSTPPSEKEVGSGNRFSVESANSSGPQVSKKEPFSCLLRTSQS